VRNIMRLTIFSRLAVGYLAILLIMGAVNGYTVLNLYRLNDETASIFNTDGRLLDIKKNLSDSFLSQLEHEKKYTITKDIVFYNQFLTANTAFDTHFAEAVSISNTLLKNYSLTKVKAYYDRYQSIVREEFNALGANQPRPIAQREESKEKIIKNLLDELKTLEANYRQDMYTRMNAIRNDASYASRLAAMMLVIAFFLVIGTSFLSTRSITKPLKALVEKTKEISEGVFEGDLAISSPPEIVGLTKAVNVMCDKLKRVDTMKSDFFSAMSHELRTPLTSIKQGIVLLQQGFDGDMSDKQKKLLTILSQETHRLIEMVNSLLDLSKMEAGMMAYHFHQEKLPPLIQRVILEMTPLMEAKKIRPRIVVSQDIPLLTLDRERILQALRNLVANAVKYTPEGGQITISAFCRDHEVECVFKDTGPGIPKENLIEIFEKFHQLPVKTSEWAKGTGLGLAFVKNIITAHGGRIWAESVLGQGSTFIFVLPY
jgi:two-component system, NtrC family, sensor histidine kinase GlrK